MFELEKKEGALKAPDMKNAALAASSNAQARFYAVPEVFFDQWNCSSSVEPVKAVTLERPPWMTVVTSSK